MKGPVTLVVLLTFASSICSAQELQFSDRFQQGPLFGKWEVIENRSAIDDSRLVTAMLPADQSRDTALILRCKEHETEAFFFKGTTYFGIGKVRVFIRFGREKPIVATWNIASTGAAAVVPNPLSFIKRLQNNGILAIRAIKADNSPIEGLFNLGDVEPVREKLAQACNRHQP